MMATINIHTFADGYEIVPARSTVETEPTHILDTGKCDRIRTYTKVSGTVSTLALRLWFYVHDDWYQGPTTDDGDALTGAVNEARDWDVDAVSKVGFTVSTISGGGTVTVRAEGLREAPVPVRQEAFR